MTECTQESFAFAPALRRDVVARFDAAPVSSGGALLREVDRKTRLLSRPAQCFSDGRDPGRVAHTVEQLLAQRVSALALGYADLNDHGQPSPKPTRCLAAPPFGGCDRVQPVGVDLGRRV